MRVLRVEHVKEHKLRITFSDKSTKIVDFEEKLKHAKGIFLPLKDIDYFKQVSVDDCCASICWPNGADICPDVLYAMGGKTSQSPKKRKSSLRKSKPRKRPRSYA